MIGIIFVSHGYLGKAMIDAALTVLESDIDAVVSIDVNPNDEAKSLRERISNSIVKVNRENGVLILTDMFGGSPSNISYSFLEEGKIDVISGANLPCLIRAIQAREKKSLPELVTEVVEYAQKSISSASAILKGNKKEK